MPKRARSHQLESQSLNFFESLLPDEWVCRKKDQDYGVDLEVEIFDHDGASTGLTFLVQVKATDDLSKEKLVSIKVDRLKYLMDLDAPSMVVRFCHPTRTVHFEWVANLIGQVSNPWPETTTLHFAEPNLWSAETSSEVPKTLKVFRRLKGPKEGVQVGLVPEFIGASPNERYALESTLSRLHDLTDVFVQSTNPEECLPVQVSLHEGRLLQRVDRLTSIADYPVGLDERDLIAPILYGLAMICGRFGLKDQRKEVCRLILEGGYQTKSRFQASEVATFSIDTPDVAAEIAIMNELHTESDLEYMKFSLALQASKPRTEEKRRAIERFNKTTLEAHQDAPAEQQAVFHYNLANFLMNEDQYFAAVMHFNLSRKFDPRYLERAYFQRELASCLFRGRKYRSAARYYQTALELEPISQTAICAGDALLYSGQFESASAVFEQALELASVDDDTFHIAESWLKHWVSSWGPTFSTIDVLSGTSWISHRPFWMRLIEDAVMGKEFALALAAALFEGFLADNDEGLWADAIGFAFNTQDPELNQATLTCAVFRTSRRSYGLFRKSLVEQAPPPEMLEHLDTFVSELMEKKRDSPKRFTARLPDSGNSMREIQF